MGRVYKEYFFRAWPFCPAGFALKRFLWLFLCPPRDINGVWTMGVPTAFRASLYSYCSAAFGSRLESKSAFVSSLFHAVICSNISYYHECIYVEMDQEKAL